ncbi:MAG: hypothetical protein FJ387_01380 [Verrucomicrobia bacterium]|nr:hypothetical protein [Verrucomicrobiota bacterium]
MSAKRQVFTPGFGPLATLSLLLLCLSGSPRLPAAQAQRELIRDARFQHGFLLLEPKPGQRVVYGEALDVAAPAKPAWDLAQWSSKFPLAASRSPRSDDGLLSFTNLAKRVCVGRPGSPQGDLVLGVNARAEYGNRARQTQQEPWVHLLVQQSLADLPSLVELSSCHFHLQARLTRSELFRTDDYTPSRHAAQFLVFLTVANRNRTSPGYGQYYWFGIPIYDDRNRMVPSYQAQDFGDTKMFIYTLASDAFAQESTHGGQWVTFARDLLPLLWQGLEAGSRAGFMQGSRDATDYCLSGIVIGWEVPGVFDVEVQLRSLSLKAAWTSVRTVSGANGTRNTPPPWPCANRL